MSSRIHAPVASLVAGLLAFVAPLYLLGSPIVLHSVWADALTWIIGIALTAGVLARLLPGFAHLALLGLVLAWLVFGVGPAQAAVVAFWLLSAWSLGAGVLCAVRPRTPHSPMSATLALLLGTSLWLAVWAALLHFPINLRGLYLGLCVLPFFWLPRLAGLFWPDMRARAMGLHDWMRSIPFWAWAAGVIIIGWSLRWASFPSLAYDDHGLHLRLWTELLTHRRALFDVENQIWSVAPFATDLLHAGGSLMAGADVRSAMNLALGLGLLALMARILQRLQTPAWVQWLLLVLMASTPMLGNMLLSLQTELLLAVVTLAGLRLVIDAPGDWRGEHVLGVMASAALCAAIKLPGAVLGVTLIAALALRWCAAGAQPAAMLRWPALVLLLPLTFVALQAYAVAWWTTGNPVFPLYNAVFHSPLAPAGNFKDPLWIHGFSLQSYVQAFFETSRFFEGSNHTAGWQYLWMLPLALVAVWHKRVAAGFRLALVPLLGFGLIMFSATQYWRYLFPVMPVAGIVLAALFIGKSRWSQAVPTALALACIGLNLYFYPGTYWGMVTPAQSAYTPAGKKQLAHLYAPAALLTAEVNRLAAGARVLYSPDSPSGATLQGTPVYINWYAPAREIRFKAIRDAQGMTDFVRAEKVDFAIVNMAIPLPRGKPLALLRDHLAEYGTALAQEGNFMLYRLGDTPTPYRKGFELRSASAPALLLPVSEAGITATDESRILAVMATEHASQARYSVRLRCSAQRGHFVAQINWDVGAPYYRLVACDADEVSFAEAVPIPARARQGLIYLTMRDAQAAQVSDMQIELY
ncbi:MAG: hypothetical protein RR311_03510 [Comamonas sp.]